MASSNQGEGDPSRSLWRLGVSVVLVIAVLFVLGLILSRILQPPLNETDLKGLTDTTATATKDRLEAINARRHLQNEARAGLLQFFGGVVALFGVGFGAITAWRQLQQNMDSSRKQHRLDREAQLTEQFTHAITYVSESAREARVGGVYALERFARTAGDDDDRKSVYELLSTVVRERTSWKPPVEAGTASAPTLVEDVLPLRVRAPEVQAALDILTQKKLWVGVEPLHLPRTDLRKVTLRHAKLTRAHLEGAHLEGGSLEEASLEGAQLNGAHLEGAYLQGAHLEGAYLEGAHLEGAHLEGTYLQGAHLENAQLDGAHLKGAHLDGAQFVGASLKGADLRNAFLYLEKEQRVSFQEADLRGADLSDVYPDKTIDLVITNVDWSGARVDNSTKWPDEKFGPIVEEHGHAVRAPVTIDNVVWRPGRIVLQKYRAVMTMLERLRQRDNNV